MALRVAEDAGNARAAAPPAASPAGGRRLFVKYAAALIALVTFVLLANGAFNLWLDYSEAKAAAYRVQREKAAAAAQRIEQFVFEIERTIGWTTYAQWAAAPVEQRRFDYVRLLRQAPAITELAQIDERGREVLKVSRLAMDVIGSGADRSQEPKFVEALARKVWFSPVYFRNESEPYMTIAVAHAGRQPGVTAAEVNLKLIWDVVTALKVGTGGYAYVVDRGGRLIAHPDISLVLRNTDLSGLPQVAAAAAGTAGGDTAVGIERGVDGRRVLSASAGIPRLDWLVFVELPIAEALAPLYGAMLQTVLLLAVGLVGATLAALFMARRMAGPIAVLQAGAMRLGAGDLQHRIEVRTGDELERLADGFNRMAAELQASYADLERKVEERTAELREALAHQTATAEVLSVISRSTVDLDPVLRTVLQTAVRLCHAEQAGFFLRDGDVYYQAVGWGSNPDYAAIERGVRIAPDRDTLVGRAALLERSVQIEDALADPEYGPKDDARTGGVRSMIGVPLRREGSIVGVFALARNRVEPFSAKQVELIETFADQAVIAIENVRLLRELQARTDELAQSVNELQILAEVGQAVSSSLDLATVLRTIVSRAVELGEAEAGMLFRYRKSDSRFRLETATGLDDDYVAAVGSMQIAGDNPSALGTAVAGRQPVQIPDLAARPSYPLRDLAVAHGFRAVLMVPLVGADRVYGVLSIQRRAEGAFPARTVRLMETFGSQSVLAIQNARLFREIEEQGHALAVASQHKSQFLANMSHELRTPLNAVLGYSELLVDGLYGPLAEKQVEVLERVQSNGKHLLGLINDVLDLSKIEAGKLTLALEDYAVGGVVQSVVAATESLASGKGLELRTAVAEGLPLGRGDERRLTQVLLNLVGNAIKFTDRGHVEIAARLAGDGFEIAVADTGPGIAAEHRERIFEAFRQVDDSSTRAKGGTGLGLAISKRIVEMHGGRLAVESEPGQGSVFRVWIPVRVEEQLEVA